MTDRHPLCHENLRLIETFRRFARQKHVCLAEQLGLVFLEVSNEMFACGKGDFDHNHETELQNASL